MTILKHNKQVSIKENALWQFSLKFYADDSNRIAFLFLQDQYNLNINMMLGLIWYAASGYGYCTPEAVLKLHESLTPWQTLITMPLRALRKRISKDNAEFYQALLGTEVFSEKMQQCIIYDFFYGPAKQVTNNSKKAKQGAFNLQTYFSICKVNLSEEAYQHARQLLSNAFAAFKDYAFPQLSLEL